MRKISFIVFVTMALLILPFQKAAGQNSWIRINLAGYKPGSPKVAVWCTKDNAVIGSFELVNVSTGKVEFKSTAGRGFGAYGPFTQTQRLDFSDFQQPGNYFIQINNIRSPDFRIAANVYEGAADFCLKYMRQQRSGFNPYLKDSCHTHDGYTMYGPMPDSTHINVSGGWHDATDYLQYSMTSANAAWHLLAAYRDFPGAFRDEYGANGLSGSNGTADVLDEAKWGLDWLLKMHPRKEWLFNQLADDRDHKGFRLPNKDSADYGKGLERPVYFCTGEPQGLGKYKNKSTGTASTAGKFTSAFALGSELFHKKDPVFSKLLMTRAFSAYDFALLKPGNSQTACNREPYYYEEDNWVDDMELASASLYHLTKQKNFADDAFKYANLEKTTPWFGEDTARHYQWYPFINPGHYELAKELFNEKDQLIEFYKDGIEKVWKKAQNNAFYRGVPFIWCSNNLNTSFAIQCYWYRKLSGNDQYLELEQACFDWLLGCNPWGTSMIVGLPAKSDYPDDPHSSLNYLFGYQTLGGLVDGPVYGTIYKKQLGIRLLHDDEYAAFQSDYVVYHDDVGDYVTNEPTMDGTASLIYLFAAKENEAYKQVKKKALTYSHGAIIRGDSTQRKIALVFTGDEFADGGDYIARVLHQENIKASFFFTGKFYRNAAFRKIILKLKYDHHYLGPHSDQHLLYCDWNNRDSLLVTKQQFQSDLSRNYQALRAFGIDKNSASHFLPPYEWYNDSIAQWTKESGLQLINFSPGTRSSADYTYPGMGSAYKSSEEIFKSILDKEMNSAAGLNGFILLVHIGTDPRRTDKFYFRLPQLIKRLKSDGYQFVTTKQLIK